jgi:hypothetical protein
MGILDIFSRSKGETSGPLEIPAGTFTVDRHGLILSSTLPSGFPEDCIRQITKPIMEAFAGAREAHLPLAELVISYSALRITAKEMRGGAMVFIAPHGPARQPKSPA